ncbi:MAG: Gfo/Idh/MocA family oxidoreductase [Candidatus Omnitrophica bacterium]|nr:Gfo/Idh/MocA family oxidoreductase [Candidatus Omnitrophota bacterium]MCM8806642.1 Gfo/Idh/MocA family oxidoreductase [Candidatus Omnitrophota bacterium]
MEIKIAFIGCGGIANAHMVALSQLSDVKFVGMCDIDENRAKTASDKYGGKVYTDWKKMLSEIEIDACYICLPPFAHEGQEELCIEKNIPFLIEKPIHLNKNKAKKIVEKIKEKNLITAVGYQDRYQDIIAYIKPFFSEGNLGFFTGWWVNGMPGVYWWRKKELSGGQAVEQTTHIFDMSRYLIGEPIEVFSVKRIGLMKEIEGYNIEDASAVSVYFENGVFGVIFSGCFLNTNGKVGLDFYFKDKVIEYTERQKVKIDYGSKIEEIYETGNLILKEDTAFIEAVKTKNQSLIKSSYEDAYKTLIFTLCANEAMEKNKIVKIKY